MQKLKQILAQEDTVLFIGSGISLWAGLPSWSGLIEELAQFVERNGGSSNLIRDEAKRGDLLQAASYGFDKLTKQQIGEFIRIVCRYGIARPSEIHEKIVSLGPRCFITTNYDDLIEQSLRKWQSDRFYRPPITNRHLTETAEIVHARAIDFIFKPHGDAGDSESIILTREQYRQLLPQGERQAALESMKMLLASRPVVYLGFGLRDPDFIYVRDILANTYKGGARDHFAVMADVSHPEIDYWRRNYGVHLCNYTTIERSDKSRDHTNFSSLLDELLKKTPVVDSPPVFNSNSPEVLLALARHASALARTPKMTPEFSIRVISVQDQTNRFRFTHNKFDHSHVESFLDSGPNRAVLIGLPGAGKSYALRRAAARLANSLNAACLEEDYDQSTIVVPIFLDLKLYRGSLSQLADQTLPKNLPLHDLIRSFKVKIFLDSFNEMPREYWESGIYESDFQSFIKNFDTISVIIGSRTSDGLEKLEFPAYQLDEIDMDFVTEELHRLGINFVGRFSHETYSLLRRPFYFKYIAKGEITLPTESHPRDFYKCFFINTKVALTDRFGIQIDLEIPLATVAYESLNRGEEVFPLAELLSALKKILDEEKIVTIDSREIANWLISKSVLIPYSGGRIAFVHQSVTEYLAAIELAKRYLSNPQTLKEKLALTRWDQALFLTLSLLPAEQADRFLQDVIATDFVLALNASKYLEIGRDKIIATLLSEVSNRSIEELFHNWHLESAIAYRLPISDVHEPELRSIIAYGNSLGAAAVKRLVDLKGVQVKDELQQLLLEKRGDYNFCVNGLAEALKQFASRNDATIISAWADQVQNAMLPDFDEDEVCGFTSGAAEILSKLDLEVIRSELLPSKESEKISEIRSIILCEIIQRHHSTDALILAGELLLRGIKKAATAIYFIASENNNHTKNQISWNSFTFDHIKCLLEIIESGDQNWGMDALKELCNARKDLATIVEQISLSKAGIIRAALMHCVSPNNQSPVFDALREIAKLSKEERQEQPFELLKRIDIDWTGQANLFVELLRTRDSILAQSLMGNTIPVSLPNLDEIEIGDMEWWLDWMLEVSQSKNDESAWWFLNQMGSLFEKYLDQQKRKSLIDEFNKADSKYRKFLLHYVIPKFYDITTDTFTEYSISFLLADLNREDKGYLMNGSILGNTATERFILERILPLLSEAQPPLAGNLRAILRQAGSRHGRRYTLE